MSAVFIVDADDRPVASDDARAAAVFELSELPELAFDHAMVLEDYRRYLEVGEVAPLRRDA